MAWPFPLGRRARLAVLASGRGTNLEALLQAFPPGNPLGEVVLVLSDNPEALALERARRRGVEAFALPWRGRKAFEGEALGLLRARGVDAVLLAGFMRLLSPSFVEAWYGRLLNIHPSLLPDYPGLNVHQRVLAAGEKETGSTVHFVDQGMDTGPILLQGRVPVLPGDTPEALEARVLRLEHRLYPKAVRLLLLGLARPPEAFGPLAEPLRALPPRERPLYARALSALALWGKEALWPKAFSEPQDPWVRGALLLAHLLACPHPALREELSTLPEGVREAALGLWTRVESPL
ncbi:phosphoribosylglycinamide formyltransferase [Thermus composti]|uniref:Phosphoribosylglycinamide formyltransferase n=1 Tax=Thermus composti TaxID=532059 RepID=A0ABV6Q137_9DEIN|nr:phosphoribosylglycinamide formyltransferase [Thermus composti]GGM96481.1 phosphoribosylglycinamide formyltransferase [Thermus composti]